MKTGKRIKGALMAIGLLTVIGVLVMVGVVVYLWWDARGDHAEFETDVGTSAETGSHDDDGAGASDDGEPPEESADTPTDAGAD